MVMKMGLSFSLALQLHLQGELIYGSQLSLASFLPFGPHAYFRTRSGQWQCQLQRREDAVRLEIINNTGVALLIVTFQVFPTLAAMTPTTANDEAAKAMHYSPNCYWQCQSPSAFKSAIWRCLFYYWLVDGLGSIASYCSYILCKSLVLPLHPALRERKQRWGARWANMQPFASHVVQRVCIGAFKLHRWSCADRLFPVQRASGVAGSYWAIFFDLWPISLLGYDLNKTKKVPSRLQEPFNGCDFQNFNHHFASLITFDQPHMNLHTYVPAISSLESRTRGFLI